jgi:hypothetical protein
MHQWIPDIAQLIFEFVYDPIRTEEDREGRATVVGLARTCRAFQDPALDVLWAQLHSLDALVLCSGGKRDSNNNLVSELTCFFSHYSELALRSGIAHCMMQSGAFSRNTENVSVL